MTRTFHPVGQGAYFTEQINLGTGQSCNIVYDCGSESLDCAGLTKVIEKSFDKGAVIDAVFISHFDRDHVNGLPILLRRCVVKKLFLPVVTSQAEVAYWRFKSNVVLDEKKGYSIPVADHLLDPNAKLDQYFKEWSVRGDRPDVHWVNAVSSDARIDDVNDGVDCFGLSDWQFTPYNYQRFEHEGVFREAFRDALRALSIQAGVDDFVNYTVDVFRQLDAKKAKGLLTEINKELRKRLGHGINGNSMALYSGERGGNGRYRMLLGCNSYEHYRVVAYASGCLYLGDYEAGKNDAWNDLEQFYTAQKCWNGIGCVQLPHHGSRHNYNERFEDIDACYVVSFGLGNKHHHPGKDCVMRLQAKGRTVRFVTEANYNLDYRMIQQVIGSLK